MNLWKINTIQGFRGGSSCPQRGFKYTGGTSNSGHFVCIWIMTWVGGTCLECRFQDPPFLHILIHQAWNGLQQATFSYPYPHGILIQMSHRAHFKKQMAVDPQPWGELNRKEGKDKAILDGALITKFFQYVSHTLSNVILSLNGGLCLLATNILP